MLSPRSNGKTRGCYCSCWAPDDRREDARNMLSCKYTSSNKLKKLLRLVGWFIWILTIQSRIRKNFIYMTQENWLDFLTWRPVYKLCVIKCMYLVHIHKKTGMSKLLFWCGIKMCFAFRHDSNPQFIANGRRCEWARNWSVFQWNKISVCLYWLSLLAY
jgi:hypothetical protein